MRAAALSELGAYLSGTEARGLASQLADGDPLSTAMMVLPPGRRARAERLLVAAGLSVDLGRLADVLHGISGARSASTTRVDPLWTLPGHLAQSSPLTSSIPALVLAARTSVMCSTFNFTGTFALWEALAEVARRPSVGVRVYVDTGAAAPHGHWQPPTTEEVALRLAPARVFRTKVYEGHLVVNHAKFVVVDHRVVLVTSANFSYSAAYRNVELGLKIDDEGLAGSVEREMQGVEDVLYERVPPHANNGASAPVA